MFSIYNNMRNFLSYNSQDVDLIRKCTDIHHRSRSRDLSKDSKSTKIANYGLEELEGTKKIPKFYMR